MARTTGPVCRLCRRDGLKLFLKGHRCDSPKCAFERRDVPPGMHNTRRGKMTDYGVHLREKQKVKHYYGILERQFRGYFARANSGKGNTGEALMSLLERRLDNIVHRMGFAHSRAQARQLINHGHITVNGRKLDIASYLVKMGDVIRVKNKAKSLRAITGNIEEINRQVPDFLSVTTGSIPEGIVSRLPGADDVSIPVQANLIIELCSK